MTIDVFELRDRVVEEYREYVKSFITIADERLAAFAREQLERGTLWPDAILQLNPAFAPDCTLGELARDGVILEETAAFFGRNLRLYRHQREALEAAKRGKSYVVSTGTGSGKSLTYLLPIVDEILRDGPEAEGVRAIIVYPMNALINSQLEALKRYQKQAPQVPVRFARYTGQEEQAERENVRQHLPHILLTNYAMLEYILVRPYERTLLEQATEALRFIVLDEMHVYRGRQGADVAMLLRRLRQRAGHRPRMIGTSATLATEGTRAERRAAIARGATTLFGVEVQPEDVIDETLERVSLAPTPRGRVAVRAAVEAPPPAADPEAVRAHPLVAWIEEAFGIAEEDGRLVRRPPETFAGGVRRLAEESGLDEAFCRERLQATLEAGNAALLPSGEPVFAFRLHQFLSSGGNIYATLHRPTERTFSSEGINRDAEGNVYYPLMFCRECGQEFYRVWRTTKTTGQEHLEPRDPLDSDDQDEQDVAGYLTLDPADFALWSDTDDLFDNVPDSWVEIRKNGPRVKKTYEDAVPRRVWVWPDGRLLAEPKAGAAPGWWQSDPLLLCPRCRTVWDRRGSEYRRLASFGQAGRSTATTVALAATIAGLTRTAVNPSDRKVLSFTELQRLAVKVALSSFCRKRAQRGICRSAFILYYTHYSYVSSRTVLALHAASEYLPTSAARLCRAWRGTHPLLPLVAPGADRFLGRRPGEIEAQRTWIAWSQRVRELLASVAQVAHDVVARWTHAVLHPVHRVVEGLDHLLRAEVAVTRRAHNPLHQQVGVTGTRNSPVQLALERDRHVEVAGVVNGDQRVRDLTGPWLDLGVGTMAAPHVPVWIFASHPGVDLVGCECPVWIDAVDREGVGRGATVRIGGAR